jgi:hypothetical protein
MSCLTDIQLQDQKPWLLRWKTLSIEIVDWLSEKLQNFMPHNFNGRFRNASALSKMCAKTPDWWSETTTIFHLWKLPPNFNTGDETWFYGYDVETKQQSSHWKSPASPRYKKPLQMRSWVKALLLVFYSIIEEFVPEGKTLIKIIIWRFWDVYGVRYEESDLKFGLQEAGSSITIMLLLT